MENGYTNKKVINIARLTHNIGCFVTEEEYKQIQNNIERYGFKNTSEYMRSALEFFDARRYNASKQSELNIIQDCIELLHDHKKHVSNQMMQESLKNLDENLEEFGEKPSNNLEEIDDKTFKEYDTNLESSKTDEIKKDNEPFEKIINTLIRITAAKGRATKEDFQFQADRCGKRASEVKHYYEENYEFFVRESDKYG